MVPPRIVTELSREADVRLWLTVLNHPRTAKLGTKMRTCELAVTGPTPAIPATTLGLGGQRPDKLRKALERAAQRGNDLQTDFQVVVLPRAKEGLKLRVIRLPSEDQAWQPRTPASATEDPHFGTQRRLSRQWGTSDERDGVGPDEGRDVIKNSTGDFADATERPDVAALLHHGWPRVTEAQRQRLDEVASKHGGPEWAADVIRRTPLGMDPLGRVFRASRQSNWREPRQQTERGGR